MDHLYLKAKDMDEPGCGDTWLTDEDDFVIKSLSKKAIMRLK